MGKSNVIRYLLHDMLRLCLKCILWGLEKMSDLTRKRVEPKYPCDKKIGKITLPEEVEYEIRQLAEEGKVPLAVQKVLELTGAGLRISKDYVDTLRPDRNR
ncbi:MAG: hypothetical protein D3914_11185 [Candidatus Electrothrix sp. LOE2]|jgi:hypothetical protein|nr:hypothetical protein [Candidatus Electrothrix sp. LOE2]